MDFPQEQFTNYWPQIRRNIGRMPCWDFPDQILGPGLVLCRLDLDNYPEVPALFKNDCHPFVDPRFREEVTMRDFALHQLSTAAYSNQAGAVDYLVYHVATVEGPYRQINSAWLRSTPQLPPSAELAGILHVYDLRVPDDGAKLTGPPKLGVILSEAYRARGIGRASVRLLEEFVRRNVPTKWVDVEIERENTRSIGFFQRLGFREVLDQGQHLVLRGDL